MDLFTLESFIHTYVCKECSEIFRTSLNKKLPQSSFLTSLNYATLLHIRFSWDNQQVIILITFTLLFCKMHVTIISYCESFKLINFVHYFNLSLYLQKYYYLKTKKNSFDLFYFLHVEKIVHFLHSKIC